MRLERELSKISMPDPPEVAFPPVPVLFNVMVDEETTWSITCAKVALPRKITESLSLPMYIVLV